MGQRNDKIFYLLEEQHKKAADMADCLGISKPAISYWKKNGTEPTYEQCAKLAVFFGVPVEEILGNNGVENDETNYYNLETYAIAEKIRENQELKALFDVAQGMPKERLEAIYNLLKEL